MVRPRVARPEDRGRTSPGSRGNPDSRSSALISGREKCQSCGVLEAMAVAQPRAVAYADLSHGQPGHICALPGAGRNTEAGQ